MKNPVVGMRVTEAEYERIKSLTESSGMKDMSAFCKDIIRRELKKRGIHSDDNIARKPPSMIPKRDGREIGSCGNERDRTDSSSHVGDPKTDNIARPSYTLEPQSTSVSRDRSSNWFAVHLAKLDRDCGITQSKADKLKSDLDMLQAVFHKSAAESLKVVLDTKERIQNILADANESFLSAKEQMRTDMESQVNKFKAETLKLKKAAWLSAVFALFAVSVPAGGWLVYKYNSEKVKAEMGNVVKERPADQSIRHEELLSGPGH